MREVDEKAAAATFLTAVSCRRAGAVIGKPTADDNTARSGGKPLRAKRTFPIVSLAGTALRLCQQLEKETEEHMTAILSHQLDLRRCVPMARQAEHECATEYVKTRNPVLAERLIAANLRLVVKIAHGYRRGNHDVRDLIQEGNVGLVRAVLKYDPQRGVKLCSYAAWWIRAYILRYLIDNWQLVKVGTTQAQRKLFFSLRKEQRKLEADGSVADVKQLALALQVTEKDVAVMLERFAGGETSLDAPLRSSEPEARTMADFLTADAEVRPDAAVEGAELAQIVQHKLRVFRYGLRGRDLALFQRRLLSDEPTTLVDLASDFGVSRERVRQLEERLKGRIGEYLRYELGDAVEPQRMAA